MSEAGQDLDVLNLALGWSPLPSRKHEHWFQIRPTPTRRVLALLGGWASGKTNTVLRRHLIECLKRPYHEGYGDGRPTSVVMSPTSGVLATSTIPTWKEICPPELILRERKSNPITFDLINGHRIFFLSAAAAVEGLNLTHCTLDEIQHVEFTSYPSRFANMQSRLRDVKAQQPFLCLVAGLPEHGKVKEWCLNPGAFCVRVSALDNRYLKAGTVKAQESACSHDEVATKVRGEWGAPPDRSFKSYDPERHVVDVYGDKGAETWIGFDFGRSSCMLIGQPQKDGSLVIVDEINLRDPVTKDLCREAKRRGWDPSVISVDPSSSVNLDSLRSLAEEWPHVLVIKRHKSHPFYREEYGWSWMSRCLLSGAGDTRLFFSRRLNAADPRGLLNALANAKSNQATGLLVRTKDQGKYADHPLDACRYICSLLDDRDKGLIGAKVAR